jgi:hypothetical protein
MMVSAECASVVDGAAREGLARKEGIMHGHAMCRTWGAIGLGLLALSLALPSQAAATGHGAPTDVCRSMKLQAAGHYFLCLLQADADQAQRERCDLQFARAFERADRIGQGCEPDRPDRMQDVVRGFSQGLLTGAVSPPPCTNVTADGDQVVCWLVVPSTVSNTVTTLSSVNLQSLINQLQLVPPDRCAPCASITANTVLWLQAWGAENWGLNMRAHGGFAQTVTSISDLMGRGIQNLHFYLGAQGRAPGGSESGGETGGAATIVTGQDLTLTPAQEPDFNQVLLIAGGAGGGGGCNTNCTGCPTPGVGGDGAVAIATTTQNGAGEGGQGWGNGVGGWGGHGGVGGSGVFGGHGSNGVGGRGGFGGEGADGNVVVFNPAWYNIPPTQLTFTSGQGQGGGGFGGDAKSCAAGAGGGGGGWGGGGGGTGGVQNGNLTHPGGGGGGGSFAIRSTRSDGNAPTTRQAKPGSTSFKDGFIQLVFDTNPS